MDSQLFTLSKIFTERLFRIPDYQRGYAWTAQQLIDFWNDIQQIEKGSNHYTGVLTLEIAPNVAVSNWKDDTWIIESKSYEPYYVVDGQQRLTTAIILIQSIIEITPDDTLLNYTTTEEIRKKYIFDTKDGGIPRSYIFGYEKDNPSYEFLKTKVFLEFSSSSRSEETAYTNNLEYAKAFFKERLTAMSSIQIEDLYKKITQHILFNIFTISEEVDVCVAFETMNNRGKPLSDLELLKNRLIYLSLKINEPIHERLKLRTSINDCWKEIYHSLGRNKDRPLNDDIFLGTHYLLYFSKPKSDNAASTEKPISSPYYGRKSMRDQGHYKKLLKEIYVTGRIYGTEGKDADLKIGDIYDYVSSLQRAVNSWYAIFNPQTALNLGNAAVWLDKLDRINGESHFPLALSVLLKTEKDEDRNKVLKALERYIFVLGVFSPYYGAYYEYGFAEEAIDLYHGKTTPAQIAAKINESTKTMMDSPRFFSEIKNNFKSRGFYAWPLIRYFLYEYNLDMQERSKTDRAKIVWNDFTERRTDFSSVEHIYPQNARAAYWTDRFSGFSAKQRDTLRSSLGNLLPLSKPKNSSISNKPFPEKVDGKKDGIVGYRFGCYAENEVSKENEWTPDTILKRGLKMLTFMERRWGFQLGDEEEKTELLGLDFLKR